MPTEPVEIIGSHPLAADLQGLWVPGGPSGGSNLVGIGPILSPVGAYVVGGMSRGPGSLVPSSVGGGLLNTVGLPSALQISGNMTVFTFGHYGTAGFYGAQNPTIFGINLPAVPYISYGLTITNGIGTAEATAFFSKSSSAYVEVIDSNFIFSYAKPILLAGVLNSGTLSLYADTNITSAAYSGAPYYGSFQSFGFGEVTANARSPNWTAGNGGVYSRALSPGELSWLRTEPFAMLQRRGGGPGVF